MRFRTIRGSFLNGGKRKGHGKRRDFYRASGAGSTPAFGTPLPEEMRSLGYPTKNSLRGTIAILKGSPG